MGDHNNVPDITFETIKVGRDFLIVMQEQDNQNTVEIITKIEQFTKSGGINYEY